MNLIERMILSTAGDDQDECDDPDCACHDEDGSGDGAAGVTMTEVYDAGEVTLSPRLPW